VIPTLTTAVDGECVMLTDSQKAYICSLQTLYWKDHCHTLLPSLCMTRDPALGCCPDCGEHIPQGWLLVEYEKDSGETGIWAECPSCNDVVRPE
jgi:hypothetical protein